MAALFFFFFIVLISLRARFVTAVFACILAVLCFNYFFAPPLFDLRMRDPGDVLRSEWKANMLFCFHVSPLLPRHDPRHGGCLAHCQSHGRNII